MEIVARAGGTRESNGVGEGGGYGRDGMVPVRRSEGCRRVGRTVVEQGSGRVDVRMYGRTVEGREGKGREERSGEERRGEEWRGAQWRGGGGVERAGEGGAERREEKVKGQGLVTEHTRRRKRNESCDTSGVKWSSVC